MINNNVYKTAPENCHVIADLIRNRRVAEFQNGRKIHPRSLLERASVKGFTLAEGASHGAVSNSHRKAAFTLAEVLITLGIIGVVAAMALPALVTQHKEKETSVRLKKVYTTLGQALNFAIAEYGTVDGWGLNQTVTGSNENGELITDNSGTEKASQIFKKYLNGKFMEIGWDKDIDTQNMQYVSLSIADGIINYAPSVNNAPTAVRLNDGTIIMFGQVNRYESCKNADYCLSFSAYFSDKTKKLVQGRNYFTFFIMKDRIIPWGLPEDRHNPFERNCKINTNNRQSGRGCTAWVIYNENMDYLHCNDLSWNGKKKCR